MAWVALVIVLALLELLVFQMLVGKARGKYGVNAPATTGNEIFERYFRVQENTVEQLLLFLPGVWLFATFISPTWAALLGAVFIVGRAIYAATYIADPKKRGLGFALSMLPNLALLIGALIGAVRGILATSNVS
jgi:glutathione S-transferase